MSLLAVSYLLPELAVLDVLTVLTALAVKVSTLHFTVLKVQSKLNELLNC